MLPSDPQTPSPTERLPPVTWSPTAPGIPVGVAGEQTIHLDEALARLAEVNITLRRAGFRDLIQTARIQRQAFPPRLAYSLTTLLTLSLLPIVQFRVAVRGREVLGCALGDRNGLDARVINIAVAESARREGIGAALLLDLEERLPGGDMVLMVQRENDAAHALYRRAGYVDVGRAVDYYGRGRDGIWMRKHRPTPYRQI